MVEEGRRGRRRRLCGRPTLPESILASSSSASALTPCRPCSASVSPEGKKEEAERGGGRERQRVARWRRRDRTLSSLTEGKRETHSLLPRLLARSLAATWRYRDSCCSPPLTAPLPRSPRPSVTSRMWQSWQDCGLDQRETVSKLQRKLGESCSSERTSERASEGICRRGSLHPSVRRPCSCPHVAVRSSFWECDFCV